MHLDKMVNCEICDDDSPEAGKLQKLYTKGYENLISQCKRIGDSSLLERLEKKWTANIHVTVHRRCRTLFMQREAAVEEQEQVPRSKRPKLAQSVNPNNDGHGPTRFPYSKRCIICNEDIHFDERHPGRQQTIHRASTMTLKASLIRTATARNDALGIAVKGRLESIADLVAEEAVYHNKCYSNLCNDPSRSNKSGRSVDSPKEDAFNQLCKWIDSEMESGVFTVSQLHQKMKTIVGDDVPVYHERYLKEALLKHYSNSIFITNQERREDVVCFRSCTEDIIRAYHDMQTDSEEEKKKSIIKTAASLIVDDIKCLNFRKDEFPTLKEMTSHYELPESLEFFLTCLMPYSSVRRNVTGQNIISAQHLRSSKMPFQLGMGLYIDHKFGSEQLINILHRLGVCESPKETTDYKYTYIESTSTTNAASMVVLEKQIEQHVGDSMDHDLITLDGKSGFHAMGQIKITTPENVNELELDENRKMQRKPIEKSEVLSRIEGLQQYVPKQTNALLDTKLMKYDELLNKTPERSIPIDVVVQDWYNGWVEGRTIHPNFMGFMHQKYNGLVLKSSIEFLRIINANPNDMHTIYTTISRAIKGTHRSPAIITFDLPLYIKASQIVKDQKLDVVVRLGGFHLLKSYLGCIGHIMGGSGLDDAMEVIYGKNTVKYILQGAAYSKALRAHFLTDAALLKHALSKKDCNSTCIVETLKELEQTSRTAKLWVLYHDLVATAQAFILAERLHDWHGHLNAVSKMLGTFAAAGHSQYAKFGRVYLQEMLRLPEKYPKVYEAFMAGNHTTRYSNEQFSGQFSDQTIEETLMRKAKSNGGLTRGRMRNKDSVKVWTGTFSHLKRLGDLMDEFIGGKQTTKTHADLGAMRMEKDNQCVKMISKWLSTHDPFSKVSDVMTITSLSSGLTTTDKSVVNCEDAVRIGREMQKDLDDESPVKSMMTSKKCKNLTGLQKRVKVDDKKVYIEKTQLFNRLIIMAERNEGIEEAFNYELTPVPTSLFTMDRMMRKPKKHEFGQMLKETTTKVNLEITDKTHVIDGGWLLHQVKWTNGATINSITDGYVKYVRANFVNPIVVFDGYAQELSTKDHEHTPRVAVKKVSPDLRVTPELTVSCDREVFLANEKNKQALIIMISAKMTSDNIRVHQAQEDGDTLIVRTALNLIESVNIPVVVVAQDTDILVLLCYHLPINCCNLYLQSDTDGLYDISAIEIRDREDSLFKYGWSGNDTVSAIHGHTKCAIYKNEFPARITSAFTDIASSESTIRTAGVEAMQITYGCGDTPLEKARYQKFQKQIAKGRINPDRLPPTEDATMQHSLRVHLQVVTWKHLNTSILQPIGRGWEVDGKKKLMPTMLTDGIAPESLLKGICCNCKEGERQCQSMKCSCVKSGISCVTACGVCCGYCFNGKATGEMSSEDQTDETD